ncbi:MAG: metallopeptidase family protein [Paracoccaceae bacterium]
MFPASGRELQRRSGLGEDLETLAAKAVEGLPEPFRSVALEIAINVADWPSNQMLTELDIDDPLELTGLYEGIPLTEKSLIDQPLMPDVIWLFREPILDEWRSRGNVTLTELVTHIVVHELAHHFGWTDAQIAEIDPWWE